MSEKQETNLGHFHEIIDRCHIVCSMIDDFIIDHPGMTGAMDDLCQEAQAIMCQVANTACGEESKFKEAKPK